jgi:hypothetical protein
MSLPDGAHVAYTGPETEGLAIGDQAIVLEGGPRKSHVRWVTGSAASSFSYINNSYLVVGASLDGITSAGDVAGKLVRFAVRETYDDGGPSAVIRQLRREGHGAFLDAIGEEAVRLVAGRVRQDPSVIEVLGSLNEDEGMEFVSAVSLTILQQAGR